jgi:hypothetical protein
LDNNLIKTTLKDQLTYGKEPAISFLYNRYSAMLLGFTVQFIPDRGEAEKVLAAIFDHIANRLQDACTSSMGVYCWLQAEARKIILDYKNNGQHLKNPAPGFDMQTKACYAAFLQDASTEHQAVFRELFYNGRKKEEVARCLQKDIANIDRLLRECLQIIRKKLL